jgi:hypothetical protein
MRDLVVVDVPHYDVNPSRISKLILSSRGQSIKRRSTKLDCFEKVSFSKQPYVYLRPPLVPRLPVYYSWAHSWWARNVLQVPVWHVPEKHVPFRCPLRDLGNWILRPQEHPEKSLI